MFAPLLDIVAAVCLPSERWGGAGVAGDATYPRAETRLPRLWGLLRLAGRQGGAGGARRWVMPPSTSVLKLVRLFLLGFLRLEEI